MLIDDRYKTQHSNITDLTESGAVNCSISTYFSSGDNVNAILCVVQSLKHGDER
jgi:hypothetical protein